MKKQLFSFLLLLSFTVSLSAQKAQTAASLETNLRKHVEYLASEKLEGRRAGEAGATEAAKYIADQFAKLRLRTVVVGANGKPGYLQPFSYTPVRDPHSTPAEPTGASTAPNAKSAYNVIGILDGYDKVLRNEAIVIGAHYDHLGRGGRSSLSPDSADIHYGADDNASGTAAIIELARMFKSEPGAVATGFRNKRTLIFIAFSGEEDGLFGSKYYVNNPVWPLDKTIAMINLDMVGRLNDRKLTIGGIGTANEWKAIVGEENIGKEQPSSTLHPPGFLGPPLMTSTRFALTLNDDGFGPSDHSSFYGKQIPVLFFFTGTHLDYHKSTDTAEKINYDGLTKIANYVGSIVRAIDENPTRPTYKVAQSSGMGGRAQFSVSLGTIPSYADTTDGLVLDGVREGSPAAKAGLKAGDKVIKLNGREVRNAMDYTEVLGTMKAGEEYEIVIKRGTETLVLKIIPAPARRI